MVCPCFLVSNSCLFYESNVIKGKLGALGTNPRNQRLVSPRREIAEKSLRNVDNIA